MLSSIMWLVGCIPFGAYQELQDVPEDTALVDDTSGDDMDSAHIDDTTIEDTSVSTDTGDTDTEETDTDTAVAGYDYSQNALYMSGSHLKLHNGLLLRNEWSSGEPGFGSAAYPLLNLSKDWGFALKWAPDSSETAEYIFGTDEMNGREIVLFNSGNHFLTVQFIRVPDSVTHKVNPTLRFVSMNSGVICRDVSFFNAQMSFEVDSLSSGVKLYVAFQNGVNQDYLRFAMQPLSDTGGDLEGYLIYEEAIPNLIGEVVSGIEPDQCINNGMTKSSFSQRDTLFTSQAALESQDQSQQRVLEPLEGLVDDLLVFKTQEETYEDPGEDLFSGNNWGDLVASSSGNTDRNMFWFNFDTDGTDDHQIFDAGFTAGQGGQPLFLQMFTMTEDMQPTELEHGDSSQYYHGQ